MAYYIPVGYSRVVFEFAPISLSGSRPAFGIGVDEDPSPENLDVFEDWAESSFAAILSSSYTIEKITMRNDAFVQDRIVSITGEDSSATAAPNVSALVRQISGLSGRANRGRFYLPGVIAEAQLANDGRMSDANRNALQLSMSVLAANMTTIGMEPVILHQTEVVPTPVTQWVVQQTAATQRRRLRK